jgi:NAD(P)-dependent dehydrogenase (short-subunit alcohol dehydrogenase family)
MGALWPDVSFAYPGTSVIVTGGTSGLGEATARAYQAAGSDVTITGTRPSINDYDGDFSGFCYRQLDLEDNTSIDALIAGVDRLDILVNNAAMAFFNIGLDERDPDVFDRALKVHLSSAYRLSSGCIDKLAQSKLPGGGSIIGIASVSSTFGFESVPGYSAGKTGVVGLTRSLAVRLGPRNIRCNALIVGFTRTKMTNVVFKDEQFTAVMKARTPLGRLGRPSDSAGAILYLTSSAASWITGQTLTVDGGYTICG